MREPGAVATSIDSTADTRYVGSAWRSRFLRSPKLALRLAERDDFVPVSDLARVSLGLKTGADKFFFLRREETDTSERKGQLVRLGRTGVSVSGFEKWRGVLASSDLLGALVGPHELFIEDKRRFCVPRLTTRLYLYPRDRRPRAQITEYVRLAELAGLNAKTLVSQNAGEDAWYIQARPLVRDRWALPYSSAYDYGAWDNSSGAVLNGRFVGVSALDGIDSEMLGIALNSTFALIGRLPEGMATGTEGAFDVGPPAVRKIRIPDIRKLTPESCAALSVVLKEMRKQDVMPRAPSADGHVHALRRRLDFALLTGLGLSDGKAAALLNELYAKYARWRKDVEQVELQMRQNRREMAKNGQTRATSPVDAAGRRVWEEVCANFPLLPSAFLSGTGDYESVEIPKRLVLHENERLLDPGLLVWATGRVDLRTHARVRYVSMLRRIGFVNPMQVPCDDARCTAIVDRFEQLESEIIRDATGRAAAYIPKESRNKVASATLHHWYRACRDAGMVPALDVTSPTLTAPLAVK